MNETISQQAERAVKCINQTGRHVFLTGKAGTGKTTFLRYIIGHTYKKTIVVAPTGIAALNAGGVTIHSMFQLPFGAFVPQNSVFDFEQAQTRFNTPVTLLRNQFMHESKRKILREVELIVLDEVSMLRADVLDAIDTVLRHVRKKNTVPFGGVQLLFIGDLLQLPPVVKDEEWNVLKAHYPNLYFFSAHALNNCQPLYIELNKIYRQSDNKFIEVLNQLRNNTLTPQALQILTARVNTNTDELIAEGYITLTTHNYKANAINSKYFDALQTKQHTYEAICEGDFPEYMHPVDEKLSLKEGAQIMFVKNDTSGAQRYFNGKIGKVKQLTQQKIVVEFEDALKTIEVEKYTWKNSKYITNPETGELTEEPIGSFEQYPLRLAWAITVHKSQGLTFDKAIVDIGSAFAPGQVYVALSRLKSLEGLVLSSGINATAVTLDKPLLDYAQNKPDEATLDEITSKDAREFLFQYAHDAFDYAQLHNAFVAHAKTYTKKDGKKSVKQRYLNWAIALMEQVEELKKTGDKFVVQLQHIYTTQHAHKFSTLLERIMSAKNYFEPLLNNLSNAVFNHIKTIKTEKKIKTYANELLALESEVYEKIRVLVKLKLLGESVSNNTTFSQDMLKRALNENVRIEKINEVLRVDEKEQKNEETERPKEKKQDTKKVTFDLYNEGKSITDIASLRNLSQTTVETHLAFYITKGDLDVLHFLSDEKYTTICTTIRETGKFELKALKEKLGDNYSYTDLKMGVAGYLATNN